MANSKVYASQRATGLFNGTSRKNLPSLPFSRLRDSIGMAGVTDYVLWTNILHN